MSVAAVAAATAAISVVISDSDKKVVSKKLRCYFSHPYEKRHSKKKYRIKKVLEERGVEVIDPFIGEFKILRKHNIEEDYYNNPKFKAAREMWIKDLKQVRECDMIVAWIPEPSIGCSAEIQYAYKKKKFIQIISPIKHPSFAYVLTGANQQFESVKDFENLRIMRWE